MLFAVKYEMRNRSEEKDKRLLKLFTNWSPPAGAEIKGHYANIDGSGGLLIQEAESAAALAESTAPWGAFMEISATAMVDIADVVPIYEKVYAWRDTVG